MSTSKILGKHKTNNCVFRLMSITGFYLSGMCNGTLKVIMGSLKVFSTKVNIGESFVNLGEENQSGRENNGLFTICACCCYYRGWWRHMAVFFQKLG